MTDTTTEPATEAQPARWTDDGHAVRVTLDYGQFAFAAICPFEGTDLSGKDWVDLPVCRRVLDEDGQPQPDKSPTGECYLAALGEEFTADEFFDGAAPVFEVASPFPVEYRFEGWDSEAVYVRPKPVPAAPPAERIQVAMNAAKAMNGVHERTITRLRGQLEQARLAPGPTGLTRAWSGYDDDECWLPMFANLTDAKAYAEVAFRASCAGRQSGDPGEITWVERKARTDATGYPGMFDLGCEEFGSVGWVVCEVPVHPDLASGLRAQPIGTDEADEDPEPQIPGQGALPVAETAVTP